ncbi:MAG TPA: sterol desaturase family protein [Thermoanaerobaculia bacterium]|nr:sterol desaturase family protein [Thermoanaerobaculia bacterium]
MLSEPARVVLLIAGCAVLWSLESLIPLYRFNDGRARRALPNAGLTVLLLLTNLALSFAAARVCAASQRETEMPAWLHAVIGIAALDLFAYVAHVLLHKIPFAWRFHRVHHSDQAVDVTTAFRQHPGETVWRVLWQLPAIALFGLPLWIVVVSLTVSAANAQLEHANIRLPERLDRALRLLFVTPDMHKVHHSRLQPETDSNYSNIFSVWDRLFGTYTSRVDFGALRYGLDDSRATFIGLLRMPF